MTAAQAAEYANLLIGPASVYKSDEKLYRTYTELLKLGLITIVWDNSTATKFETEENSK